jgi:membrane protease YdiL (CAAX protease family)
LLQEESSAFRSSVIVGLTWACWHTPLLIMWGAGPETSILAAGLALIPYIALTIPMAVMCTFAFNTARGLVLVPILMHGLHNHLNGVLTARPAPEEALARAGALSDPVLLILFWLFVVLLVRLLGGEDLSRRARITATMILAD